MQTSLNFMHIICLLGMPLGLASFENKTGAVDTVASVKTRRTMLQGRCMP